MYCKYCGTQNDDEAKFCVKCGKAIDGNGEEVTGEMPAPKKKNTKLIIGVIVIAIVAAIGGYLLFGNKKEESKLTEEEQYIVGKWDMLSSDGDGSVTFNDDYTGSMFLDTDSGESTYDFTWNYKTTSTNSYGTEYYGYDVDISVGSKISSWLVASTISEEDDQYDVLVMGPVDDDEDLSITCYRERS